MKKIQGAAMALIMTLAIMGSALPAQADESQDFGKAGDIAGVIAGVTTVGTLLTEAATRSNITVDIDVFQESDLPEAERNKFVLKTPAIAYTPHPGKERLEREYLGSDEKKIRRIKTRCYDAYEEFEDFLDSLPESSPAKAQGDLVHENWKNMKTTTDVSELIKDVGEFQRLIASDPSEAAKKLNSTLNSMTTMMVDISSASATLLSSRSNGPIVSEGTQAVLAESEMIDTITRKSNAHRWVRLNQAKSHNGPGNTNTIIYLDSPAVPVIKSAAYNPEKFVSANMAAYERVFMSLGAIVTLPDATSSDSGPQKNMYSVQSALAKAERAKGANAGKLQKAFLELVALQNKSGVTAKEVKAKLTQIAQDLGAGETKKAE